MSAPGAPDAPNNEGVLVGAGEGAGWKPGELPARQPLPEHRVARSAQGMRGRPRAVHRRPGRDRQRAREPGRPELDDRRRGLMARADTPADRTGEALRRAPLPARSAGAQPHGGRRDRGRGDPDRHLPRVHEGDPVHRRGVRGEGRVRERGDASRDRSRSHRGRQRRGGHGGRAERQRDRGHVHGRRRGAAAAHGRDGGDPPAAVPRGQLLPRHDPGSPNAPELEDGARSRSPRPRWPCSSTRS